MAAQAASASTQSKRRRSTTSCPERRYCRLEPAAAIWVANFARTGTSARPASMTFSRSAESPKILRGGRPARCPSVAYTYNDPTVFHEYAVDTAIACHARGDQEHCGDRRLCLPGAARRVLPPHGCGKHRLEGLYRGFLSRGCYAHLQPVLETLIYVKHETQVWLEITTLLIPASTTSKPSLSR